MGDADLRLIALDIHKTYVMVGAVAPDQTVVLRPRQIPLAQFEAWAQRHLRPTDQVVLEATTNTWDLYDLLTPLVARRCRRSGQDRYARHDRDGQAAREQ